MKSKIHEYQNKYLAMSNISKVLLAITLASTFFVASCRDTKTEKDTTEEHGHEHDADGGHMHDATIEQEEFKVEKDSMDMKPETHKHDDGSDHQDH